MPSTESSKSLLLSSSSASWPEMLELFAFCIIISMKPSSSIPESSEHTVLRRLRGGPECVEEVLDWMLSELARK